MSLSRPKLLLRTSIVCSLAGTGLFLLSLLLLSLLESDLTWALHLDAASMAATTILFLAAPTLSVGWFVNRSVRRQSDLPSAQQKAGLQLTWLVSLPQLFFITLGAGLGQVVWLAGLAATTFGLTAVVLVASIFVKAETAK